MLEASLSVMAIPSSKKRCFLRSGDVQRGAVVLDVEAEVRQGQHSVERRPRMHVDVAVPPKKEGVDIVSPSSDLGLLFRVHS